MSRWAKIFKKQSLQKLDKRIKEIEKFKEFKFNERLNFLQKDKDRKSNIDEKGLKAFDNLFTHSVKLKIIHHMICKEIMVLSCEIGKVCPSLNYETGKVH